MLKAKRVARYLAVTLFASFLAVGCGRQRAPEASMCMVTADLPSPPAKASRGDRSAFYATVAERDMRAATLYGESIERLKHDPRWQIEEQRPFLTRAMVFAETERARLRTRASMAQALAER